MTDRDTGTAAERVDADPLDGRDETEAERLDRNWNEILQELRVIQTGTQIIVGFLLTLAFQQRFTDLDSFQVDVYLALVIVAAAATILGLAPVSLHRTLFRRKAKAAIVTWANRILKITIVVVALTLSGTLLLIFDVVIGRTAGVVAGLATLVAAFATWSLLTAGAQRHLRRD
jgi:hypothetical protein